MFISTNRTPYLAEGFTSIDKACTKSFVVVVRATYDVDDHGACRLSEQQTPFVYADAHHGDPETTAIRAESDFAPVKPRAEVLLDAVAMAPGGAAVDTVEVALRGPSIDKRAVVTGERRWQRSARGLQPSAPRPFHSLPLAWHLAFGGTDRTTDNGSGHPTDPRNPLGCGLNVNRREEAIEGRPLPSIEHPASRMARWDDRPEPIGFGPVARFAAERARHAGTYDQRWMDDVLPFLPDDFDDRYFQAAPADQQLDTLAEGDTFACLHMDTSGVFRVRLPRLAVPVSFVFDDRTRVPTVVPDTLILQPHHRRVVLLGRARAPLPRKFTRLREVTIGAVGG